MDNTVCTIYDIIIGICGSIIYSSSFFKSFLKNCSLQGSLGNPKSKMVPLWHCSKTPFWNLWNEDSSSASSLESIVEYNGSKFWHTTPLTSGVDTVQHWVYGCQATCRIVIEINVCPHLCYWIAALTMTHLIRMYNCFESFVFNSGVI